MIPEEYHKILHELVDIDTEISSIADSRRLMSELNEREEVLLKLKDKLKKDIRAAESNYLRDKSDLRRKYSMDQKRGISGMIRGSPKSKLIKELKRLESRSEKNIEELKEIRYIIDDLIVQFDELRGPAQNLMRSRFGN